uniref:Uncharacterized protein n=1 Tax=Ditylenchus dipsaci TaxID=166011 RepID=A0A915CV37_9BILA
MQAQQSKNMSSQHSAAAFLYHSYSGVKKSEPQHQDYQQQIFYNHFFPPLPSQVSQQAGVKKKNQCQYNQQWAMCNFVESFPSPQITSREAETMFQASQASFHNRSSTISDMGKWIVREKPKLKKKVIPRSTPAFPFICYQQYRLNQLSNLQPTPMMVVNPDGTFGMMSSSRKSAESPDLSSHTLSSVATTQPASSLESCSKLSVKSEPANFSSSTVSAFAREKKSSSGWKVGDKIMAPFTDGKLYSARLEGFGPADLCSVFYFAFDHRSFVPLGAIKNC